MYIDRIVHNSMDPWRLIMYTTLYYNWSWDELRACLPSWRCGAAAVAGIFPEAINRNRAIGCYNKRHEYDGKAMESDLRCLVLRTTGYTNLRGNWGCPWNISKLKFKCPRLSVSPSNSIQVTADWSISANIFRGHDQNNPYRLSVCASSEQATRFQDVPRTSTCSSHCKKSVISNRFIPD